MTAQATTEKPQSGWHECRQAAQERIDAEAGCRADLYSQARRIEEYLPILEAQRVKMAADLAELARLIDDERQAVAEIHAALDN